MAQWLNAHGHQIGIVFGVFLLWLKWNMQIRLPPAGGWRLELWRFGEFLTVLPWNKIGGSLGAPWLGPLPPLDLPEPPSSPMERRAVRLASLPPPPLEGPRSPLGPWPPEATTNPQRRPLPPAAAPPASEGYPPPDLAMSYPDASEAVQTPRSEGVQPAPMPGKDGAPRR